MSKPDYLPIWASEDTTLPATGETNKVRPKESLRTIGWDMGQIPTAEEWNWQFNNMYQWIEYFSEFYAAATDAATADTLALRDSTGSLHFYNLYVDNNLEVTGTSSLTGAITATGNITSSGTNTWSGDNTFSNPTLFNGYVTMEGAAISDLIVDGEASFKNITNFNGNINSEGTNDWSGTQEISGEIRSSGVNTWTAANTFSGTVTFSGDITSTGTNSFSGVNTFSNQLNLQSSSLTTNGYTYLPNGVIMQWGQVAFNTSEATNVGASVVFPKAFPNAALSVTANTTTRYFTTSDGYSAVCACVGASSTGFTLYIDSDNAESLTQSQVVNWLAIGH